MARLLLIVVVLFTGWIGWQVAGQQRKRAERVAAAREAALGARAEEEALKALRKATAGRRRRVVNRGPEVPEWIERLQARHLATPTPAPARDSAADAARVRRYGPYTYLEAVAAQNDRQLARWPARTTPLRVWVQDNPGLPGWTPEHRSVARGALTTWDAAELPFRIVPTDDSSAADVFVLWARHFSPETQRIGETSRVTDEHGWIVASIITLALEEPGSSPRPLDVYTVQNAARHELGHVIGLDHSPVQDDIMAAFAGRQDRLSERDVNTARLLYALSPGPYPGTVSRDALPSVRPPRAVTRRP